jgi:predicted AlkP superfamily pyrophosphatase or phosphodiesterase
MNKTVVIDVVGLSTSIIGEHTPFLQNWIKTKNLSRISPAFPAVTTSVQSTYVTGQWPSEHGIVGNGWYDREECEIKFWKQSDKLVQAEKIWEKAKRKDPEFTCSKMFWWYDMYGNVDYSVTPRPNYLSDGRKIPDCYSYPADLRDQLQLELGAFPLFNFWGPTANIKSSEWIAAASKKVEEWYTPTLTLIYLPHLDYCLQKFGNDFTNISKELNAIDRVCSDLITFYEKQQANIILLSEYGITDVSQPVHINRILREEGLLQIREERELELLDAGASKAFAVADHQVAHIYVNDVSVARKVRTILENTAGIEQVLDREGKRQHHLTHERAGDYIAVADEKSWFTYYYWLDDDRAPDFARLVEIHRKPGYDPVEMFMDPANPFVKAKAAYKLLRKKLGFRYLMNVIPLDATLIKGSHGRINIPENYYPVYISSTSHQQTVNATDVYHLIWEQLTGEK